MTDWDDGAPRRSWLADALDPIENLRALADARQFGRRTAEELAERILAPDAASNGEGHRDGDGTSPADLESLVRRFRLDSVRAAELLADLIDGGAALLGELAGRFPGLVQDREATMTELHLAAVPPGREATDVFWIHNSLDEAVCDVRPHCAPLRSHLGDDGPGVMFDPPVLDPLPGRSRCGIEVRVRVAPDCIPGRYATMIFVSHVPDLYLPLRVDVVPEPEVA